MLAKDRSGYYNQNAGVFFQHHPQRRLKVAGTPYLRRDKVQLQEPSCPLGLLEFRAARWEPRVPEDTHAFGARNGRDQHFQPFVSQLERLQAYPGEVSARPGKPSDEAQADRIGDASKDDRDRLGCCLGRAYRHSTEGDYHGRPKANQLGGKGWKDIVISSRVTGLEGDAL